MKRIKRIISAIVISTALFAGIFSSCEMSLKNELMDISKESGVSENTDNSSEEYTTISFYFSGTGAKNRTALPVYEWDNYTYELYVKTPGASESKLFIEKSPFSRFMNTRKLPKAQAPYQFTLKGYANLEGTSTQVLEGTTGDVLLNTDSKELTFIMYPVEGSTGSTRIIVTFPEDGTITKVKAAVSQDRSGTSEEKEDLEITQGTSEKVCIFEKSDLHSAVKQYAVFWFYDSQENLVYSTAESLQIMGGKTSASRIDITSDFYNRRNVTVTLNKDGATWTKTNVTVIVKDSDGKTYPLTSNSDGTFSGNIAPGSYEVIVIPSGSQEEIRTGITIDTESDESDSVEKTVEFKTVNVSSDKVNIKTAENNSGIIETDASGNLIVPDGKDFSITVETKPGYKPNDATEGTPSTGTINIGGKDITVTQREDGIYEGTVSFNTTNIGSSISIPAENFTAIEYTITYVFIRGEQYSFHDSDAPHSYTTENYPPLPGQNNFTENPQYNVKLAGWHILPIEDLKNSDIDTERGFDVNTYYTELPSGTVGNIALRPRWFTSTENHNYKIEIWKEKADSTGLETSDNYEISYLIREGKIGESTNVTADIIEGFENPEITNTTVTQTEETEHAYYNPELAVAKVVYKRKTITLTLNAGDGNWSDSASKTISGKYGAAVTNTYGNPEQEDFAFAGWNTNGGTLPATFPSSDAEYTAVWTKTNANFTVKYFFEKADNSGTFEQDLTNYPDLPLKGTIGTTATAPAPSPVTGFTYATETATITEDGNAVVKVYYNRNSISLNFTLDNSIGGKWNDRTTETKTVSGKYGCPVKEVPVPAPNEDYSFLGWYAGDVPVTIPETFPLTGATYQARWNLENVGYSIHYSKDGAEWTDHSYTTNGKAAVGSTTAVTAPDVAGYTGSVINITLKPVAAQNVVEVTYVKNDITYTFDPAGGNWSGNTESQTTTGKYKDLITKPGDPSKEGFVFGGWADSNGTALESYYGSENKTVYAVWKTYVAGSGINTFNHVEINHSESTHTLQAVIPYEDFWTFVWYDAITLKELGRTSEISVTGKGKHTVILLATDSQKTEFTATVEFEIK